MFFSYFLFHFFLRFIVLLWVLTRPSTFCNRIVPVFVVNVVIRFQNLLFPLCANRAEKHDIKVFYLHNSSIHEEEVAFFFIATTSFTTAIIGLIKLAGLCCTNCPTVVDSRIVVDLPEVQYCSNWTKKNSACTSSCSLCSWDYNRLYNVEV